MTKLNKWKILQEEDVSPSKWFPVFKHKVQLPNGKIVDNYYVSYLGDVSMVVPVTSDKKIVFVHQYKHGSGEFEIELPAGRVGKHTPEEAAKIELLEETGIEAGSLMSVGQIHVEPSKMGIVVHGFVVKNAVVTKSQNLDETEEIELVKVPISELDDYIRSGEIKVGSTLGVLKLAQLKAPELFE